MGLCANCICDHTQLHISKATSPSYQNIRDTYKEVQNSLRLQVEQFEDDRQRLVLSVWCRIGSKRTQRKRGTKYGAVSKRRGGKCCSSCQTTSRRRRSGCCWKYRLGRENSGCKASAEWTHSSATSVGRYRVCSQPPSSSPLSPSLSPYRGFAANV
jgi:hypothetical protein